MKNLASVLPTRMRRVLIVDDEPAILRSTAMVLEELGYDVHTCAEASGILDAVDKAEPDVLLQDVRMPGLDIERVVAEIRRAPRWEKLPIVLFTASMEAAEIGERVGARIVLDKPFKPIQLAHALERALLVPA